MMRNPIGTETVRCYGPLPGSRSGNLCDVARVDEVIGLFKSVAAAEGWQPGDHLDRFRELADYFGLWQDDRPSSPVGGLQLVRASSWDDLPCRLFWPGADITGIGGGDARMVGEVLVLALDPTVRGRGDLFWLLGAALFRCCSAEGITDLLAEVPPRNLPLYRRLGWPFRIVGDLVVHWGEPCYLCHLNVAEVEAAVVSKAQRGSSRHGRAVADAYAVGSQPPTRSF